MESLHGGAWLRRCGASCSARCACVRAVLVLLALLACSHTRVPVVIHTPFIINGAVSGVQRHLQPTAGGDCLRSTSSVGHSSSSFAPEDAANGTGDQATSTTIILRSTRVGVQKSERGLCDTTNPGVFVFIKPHCLFLRELGWRTPPLCGRPFSTFRAPPARRILCALRPYGRRPGPAGFLPLPV